MLLAVASLNEFGICSEEVSIQHEYGVPAQAAPSAVYVDTP